MLGYHRSLFLTPAAFSVESASTIMLRLPCAKFADLDLSEFTEFLE